MAEPVWDPAYWKERLGKCRGEIHRSIFIGSIDQFSQFDIQHKQQLKEELKSTDNILDAGCGYGRLLGLMPSHWNGQYLGLDLSDDFIQIAKMMYSNLQARCILHQWDLRQPIKSLLLNKDVTKGIFPTDGFDIAIVCSIKHMIIRNMGEEVWVEMEKNIKAVSKRILYLEYGDWS